MVANRNVCHLMQLLYPLHCPPTPALRSPDPAGDTSQVCCREVRQTSGSTPDTTPTRSGAHGETEQIAIPWPLAGIISPPTPSPPPGALPVRYPPDAKPPRVLRRHLFRISIKRSLTRLLGQFVALPFAKDDRQTRSIVVKRTAACKFDRAILPE